MEATRALVILSSAFFGLVAVKFVVSLLKWWHAKAMLSNLPSPKGHWLLGHLPFLAPFDHHKSLLRWANELGNFYYIRLAWTHVSELFPMVTTFPELHSYQKACFRCNSPMFLHNG